MANHLLSSPLEAVCCLSGKQTMTFISFSRVGGGGNGELVQDENNILYSAPYKEKLPLLPDFILVFPDIESTAHVFY